MGVSTAEESSVSATRPNRRLRSLWRIRERSGSGSRSCETRRATGSSDWRSTALAITVDGRRTRGGSPSCSAPTTAPRPAWHGRRPKQRPTRRSRLTEGRPVGGMLAGRASQVRADASRLLFASSDLVSALWRLRENPCGFVHHLSALLERALVVAHRPDPLGVRLRQLLADLIGVERVVDGQRLAAAQVAELAQHRGACLVGPLVLLDGGQLDLRQLVQPVDDLPWLQPVVAGYSEPLRSRAFLSRLDIARRAFRRAIAKPVEQAHAGPLYCGWTFTAFGPLSPASSS